MKYFNPLKERFDALRTGTATGYALRVLILAAGVLLLALSTLVLGAGMGAAYAASAALVGLLFATAKPDSIGGLLTLVIVGMWWWFAGWDVPWWQAAVVGAVALVFHLACGWAAAAPLYADLEPASRGRLLRSGATVVGLGLLASALVGGVAMLPVPGAVVWTAAAVVGIIGLVALAVTMKTSADVDQD